MHLSDQRWGEDVAIFGDVHVHIRMIHRKTAQGPSWFKIAIVSEWMAFGGGASLGFTDVCTGYVERPNRSSSV